MVNCDLQTFQRSENFSSIKWLMISAYVLTAFPIVSFAAAAPAKPANVKATAGIDQVVLQWDKVIGASTYEIYEGTAPNQEAPMPEMSVTGTTATLTGLNKDQTYYFQVKAVTGVARSDPSSEVSGTPVPPNLAVPHVMQPIVADGQVQLTWTSVGADSYTVYEGTAPDQVNSTAQTGIVGTTVTVGNLKDDGTTYFFKVKAFTLGTFGPGSNEVWGTPESVTAAQQASCLQSSSAVTANAKSSTTTLSNFSVNESNESALVTVDIATVKLPAWLSDSSPGHCDPKANNHVWNAMALDFSASGSATNATFSDYAQQEVLSRYGGIFNVYWSPLAGREPSDTAYTWGTRQSALNHMYISELEGNADSVPATQTLAYISNGLGVKAVKTQQQGDSFAGVGTAYLGIGVDGPLIDVANPKTAGGYSLELSISTNFANPNAIANMFNVRTAPGFIPSGSASFTAYLIGIFSISVEYDRPLSTSARSAIHDVTMFSIGYNKPNNTGSSQ